MKKIVIITEVPEDCYHVTAEIMCRGYSKDQIHVRAYNEDEIGDRYRVYYILQDQLRNMGID